MPRILICPEMALRFSSSLLLPTKQPQWCKACSETGRCLVGCGSCDDTGVRVADPSGTWTGSLPLSCCPSDVLVEPELGGRSAAVTAEVRRPLGVGTDAQH